MCEIAVVVVDKTNPDFYQDCKCYKSGDVICVQPDGWKWGKIDLSHPNWRILKFPGVDPSVFVPHIQPQLPADPLNPSRTLLRRALKVDVTKIATTPSVAPNAIAAGKIAPFIVDATRATATLSVPLAAADVSKVTVTKATVADPNVIGKVAAKPNVIG